MSRRLISFSGRCIRIVAGRLRFRLRNSPRIHKDRLAAPRDLHGAKPAGSDPLPLPTHDRRLGFAVLLTALITIASAMPAGAQSLDFNVDANLGSGIMLGRSPVGTELRRVPTFLALDVNSVVDGEKGIEWTISTLIQVETNPALALVPKLRLVREIGVPSVYAQLGVPYFITPFQRIGAQVGGGMIWPISKQFSLIGGAFIDIFFAGGDVPSSSAVLAFNAGFGGRMYF